MDDEVRRFPVLHILGFRDFFHLPVLHVKQRLVIDDSMKSAAEVAARTAWEQKASAMTIEWLETIFYPSPYLKRLPEVWSETFYDAIA